MSKPPRRRFLQASADVLKRTRLAPVDEPATVFVTDLAE